MTRRVYATDEQRSGEQEHDLAVAQGRTDQPSDHGYAFAPNGMGSARQ